MRNVALIFGMVICLSVMGCKALQRYAVVPEAEAAAKAHRVYMTNFHRESVFTLKQYLDRTLEADNKFLSLPEDNLPDEMKDVQKHLREARKLWEKIAANDKKYPPGDEPVLGADLLYPWDKEIKIAKGHVEAAETAIKKFKGE
jgi:hypothetical protein